MSQESAVAQHIARDKALAREFRKDKSRLWQWLCGVIERCGDVRSVGAGADEMLSIGGRALGELNRQGLGFGSEIKQLLKQSKLAHVDGAGTLYVHLSAVSAGVRVLLLRSVGRAKQRGPNGPDKPKSVSQSRHSRSEGKLQKSA